MDLIGVALGLFGVYVGGKRIAKAMSASPRSRDLSDAPFLPPGAGLRSGSPRRAPPRVSSSGRMQTLAGPIRSRRMPVRNLDDRMKQISALANEGKFDPSVIAWTRRELSQKCRDGSNGEQWCAKEKDTRAEAAAIFRAMRRDIRYTSDILGADTYQHPRVTLRLRTGDCDDYSSLGCAALMSAGIPCRFKVVQTKDSDTPNHIYIPAGSRGNPQQWFSLDASVPVKPGWEVPPSMVAKSWIYTP